MATNTADQAQHGTEQAAHVALTLMDQLPILLILVPFMAAPLVVLLGSRKLAWPIAYGAATASFVMSVFLLMRVIGGEVISYHIGGWVPPLGIEYRVDAANAFVLFLITGIATVVLPYARVSILAEVGRQQLTLFYSCFLLAFTGLLGVVITGDAFNVFVFLEISSLSTYVLIAAGAKRDKRALTAAYDYLIMGTIGATFFVIGLGLLYMATGTLNMADIADRIADQSGNRTVRAAFAFILVGMGLKAAVYPLHLWLPNAYTYAPSAVTAFLAATATKVAIYVLMRFMFSVFQPDYLFAVHTLEVVLLPLAVLAMFAASIIAIFQTDLKRLLAYSSLAQIGYMLLGIGLLTETGLTAAIAHLFNHGITKAALFMGLGAIVLRHGNSFCDRITGAGKTMPWTSAAMVIGGLSLIGVPGTAGFVSKWVLVQGTLEAGWWPLAILIVLSSLLAVIYVWKMVEALYLAEPPSDVVAKEAPLSMLVPIWIMAIACIWFGLNTDVTLGASISAAQGFMNGSAGMMVH
ncbi:monovalent cation/H+ antiporter subunit D family protein [Alisedimentitalea sp. MJ-SS2]|uniref:monovalent cation/H+ antiporter subunit D family protein n=1 Tax=Aliisedimentitalea sp. MJ-SS2 TaxID=3049795 RepID=UPI00291484BC|nr:monovalent cation/H+ antiporter subunit D family protein [Alisedimentitalea sp. MJ-SS2]MDU8928836.1 monovalent cation/H+ antiporter subunit D family protein [Alisedimentitalea sp. MJ-SS2]